MFLTFLIHIPREIFSSGDMYEFYQYIGAEKFYYDDFSIELTEKELYSNFISFQDWRDRKLNNLIIN